MQTENITIKDIDKLLLDGNYVSNNEISTTVYLSLLLGRPMLIEGPPGVGKTELAKVIAKSFERDFFRIQCYAKTADSPPDSLFAPCRGHENFQSHNRVQRSNL